MSKLIIDGNAVYEIDEECMKKKEEGMKRKGKREPEDPRTRKSGKKPKV